MRKITFIYILFILSSTAFGQFQYRFISSPDSAAVFMNGEIKGYTPCKVSFFWRQAIDKKITFEVKSDGYKNWKKEITEKPWKFDLKDEVVLERDLPEFNIDSSSAVVAFDLLVADFKEGKEIGRYNKANGDVELLKWEGAIKVGEITFEERFNEIVINAGFRTNVSQNSQMFAGTQKESKLPRFIVGANLVDYRIDVKYSDIVNYGSGSMVIITKMLIEWNVLDKAINKVVYTEKTEGLYRFRSYSYNLRGNNLFAFEDALVKFLNNGKFVDLVKEAKDSRFKPEKTALIEGEVVKINRPTIPQFENISELIKHANQSCVTIITDGGHGSGAIIDEEGYVLSAYHVVEGANRIQVKFSSGLLLDANIIADDKQNDMVLLDIIGSGYKSLPLAINAKSSPGDEVITIGTPADLSLGQSVAKGIISGRREIGNIEYIQTDMAVSPGNSGGPLLNFKGEIIGVIQSKIISEGVEGIGMAIPVEVAVKCLNLKID